MSGGSVVTIGVYDGVHLGHRALIAEARRIGASMGLPVTVLTFDRHPSELVSPERAPCLLTDLAQKVELLESTGVERVEVLPFDEARRQESAERFIEDVLVGQLDARAVVVGRDFHFGHARSGNVEVLEADGRFDVHGLKLVPSANGEAVSSTRVREMLAAGEVEAAAVLLGRDHEVRGSVVRGDGRARDLGAPTANIDFGPNICMPADGIYAGWYLLGSGPETAAHPCAISLGRRPTFYGPEGALVLEAHLLDWTGDLYGQQARLCFSRHLRSQKIYDDPEALAAQMAADLDDARAVLAG